MIRYFFIISISVKDVKKKINNLRTYYSRELAKFKDSSKSGAGSDEIYVSKWPHFNSLEFLRDTIKPKKTTSSLVSIYIFFFKL